MFHHTVKKMCLQSYCGSKRILLQRFMSCSRQNLLHHIAFYRSFSSSSVSRFYPAPVCYDQKPIIESSDSTSLDSPDSSSNNAPDEAYLQYMELDDASENKSDKSLEHIAGTGNCWSSEYQLNLVKSEYVILKQEGIVQIPSELTDSQWLELAGLPNLAKRKKYLRFLFLTEKSNENELKKKARKREHQELKFQQVQEELDTCQHISYGLWRNAINIKINDNHMDNVLNHKLVSAKKFGQPIIFDFDYNDVMDKQKVSSLADQCFMCVAQNRNHQDPFDVKYFNFDVMKSDCAFMQRRNPKLGEDDCLIDTYK